MNNTKNNQELKDHDSDSKATCSCISSEEANSKKGGFSSQGCRGKVDCNDKKCGTE